MRARSSCRRRTPPPSAPPSPASPPAPRRPATGTRAAGSAPPPATRSCSTSWTPARHRRSPPPADAGRSAEDADGGGQHDGRPPNVADETGVHPVHHVGDSEPRLLIHHDDGPAVPPPIAGAGAD